METLYSKVKALQGEAVLSLPTRNGNRSFLSITTSFFSSRFKPTYKEWKPKEIPARIKGFTAVLSLPTRNGNEGGGSNSRICAACFKPTYKEWKQGNPENVSRTQSVF